MNIRLIFLLSTLLPSILALKTFEDTYIESCDRCDSSFLSNEQCDQHCNYIECNWDNLACAFGYNDCLFGELQGKNSRYQVGGNKIENHMWSLGITCDMKPKAITAFLQDSGKLAYIQVEYTGGVLSNNIDMPYSDFKKFTLDNDEFITDITLYKTEDNREMSAIAFSTSKGNSFEAGVKTSKVHDYYILPGYYVAAFMIGYENYEFTADIQPWAHVNPQCTCREEKIGDGKCDKDCFNKFCEFDDLDCGEPIEGCDCLPVQLGNDICDEQCNTEVCLFDGNDCDALKYCETCERSLVRNGKCDLECFNMGCIYDGGDCGPPIKNCPCPREWLVNDECEELCNVEGCSFDFGRCNKW